MNVLRLAFFSCVALIIGACSEKSHPGSVVRQESPKMESARPKTEDASANREVTSEPPAEQVTEDCVAFVRSTTASPSNPESTNNCPDCPGAGPTKEVLRFQSLQIDEVTSIGPTCEVGVTLHVTFNPATGGEMIRGGLTGWIPPEQKREYLGGRAPSGLQTYKVKITYTRDGREWRAVEFAMR